MDAPDVLQFKPGFASASVITAYDELGALLPLEGSAIVHAARETARLLLAVVSRFVGSDLGFWPFGVHISPMG